MGDRVPNIPLTRDQAIEAMDVIGGCGCAALLVQGVSEDGGVLQYGVIIPVQGAPDLNITQIAYELGVAGGYRLVFGGAQGFTVHAAPLDLAEEAEQVGCPYCAGGQFQGHAAACPASPLNAGATIYGTATGNRF